MNCMRTGLVSAMVVSGSFVLAAETFAAINPGTSDNPYGAITLRNVFDLRQIPIQTPPPPTNEPPPNVDLIAMTSILKERLAVFAIHEKGKPAPLNITMKEGERQGALEVVKIDMASKTARVKIDDKPTELELVEPKGAAAAPTSAGIAPALGANAGRVGFVPQPGAMAPPMAGGGLPANTYAVPSVTPMANLGVNPAVNPAISPYAAANPAAVANPGAANPLGVSSAQTRQVRTEPTLTPQQQMLLMEAQRQQLLQAGSPVAKLLPTTPLSAALQEEGQRQQNPGPAVPRQPLGSYSTGTLKQ